MKIWQKVLVSKILTGLGVFRVIRDLHRLWERGYVLGKLRRREIAQTGRFVTYKDSRVEMVFDLNSVHDYDMLRRLRSPKGYEAGVVRLIELGLNEGSTFVDVGASNGYFSLLAAAKVGPTGRVFAFEPAPASVERLRKNATLNGFHRIDIHQAAVSNYGGSAELYLSEIEDGLNSLVRKSESSTVVDVVTLDSILAGCRVDMIKIDAEGSEEAVLEGMRETIRANPELKIVIEWNPEVSRNHILKFLSNSFEVYIVEEDAIRSPSHPVNSERDLSDLIVNLYCCPKGGTMLRDGGSALLGGNHA